NYQCFSVVGKVSYKPKRQCLGRAIYPMIITLVGNGQDHMVSLFKVRKIAFKIYLGIARFYHRIIGLDTYRLHKGLGVVGESLAIAVLHPIHFDRTDGPKTADAYLNTYVSSMVLNVLINDLRLFQIVRNPIYQVF